MASVSRHYTRHVAASVFFTAALPAVAAVLAGKSIPLAIVAGILAVTAIVRLVRLIRYPISQTVMMSRAIAMGDTMLHIPETDDPLLGQASKDMNRILASYRRDQNELETRKNYYERILRIMTHELRNTVTPIVSLTDFMIQNPELQSEEDRLEAIGIINSQAHNVCNFLESYRQLTVLSQPTLASIPAAQVFGQLQTLLSSEPGYDRISFETAGNVILQADSSLLSLALINIIRNAVQATDGIQDAYVRVLASAPGGKACITVTNNGPEIPDNQIEQIFLPFYSTRKNSSGSGIGLALSRQIMQLHDGTLTCTSHYPFTVFTLQFP